MEHVIAFLRAALPWMVMGLLLAVFFVKSAGKEKEDEQSGNYGTEGMCLGICLGTAAGTALGNNTGIALSLGMLIGLAIGTCIKKEGQSGEKEE